MKVKLMTHDELQNIIDDIAAELSHETERGKVADYIPPLACVSPSNFGMSIVDTHGHIMSTGNTDVSFSIQSISKVFSLTMALRSVGETLWDRVGREPSGSPFNSIVQLESEQGIPRNPFINSGAIVISDILLANHKPDDIIADYVKFMQMLTGDSDIKIDQEVADSEHATGFRNFALGHYMRAFKNINHPVDVTLETYFNFCALSMNCQQLAKAGCYLMSGGQLPNDDASNPVLSEERTRRILALMMTCGHYDGSGEFAYRVGLPGKSGVSGGILAIVPGVASIAVWSPGLNARGNSHLGTMALERLVQRTGWSVFRASDEING